MATESKQTLEDSPYTEITLVVLLALSLAGNVLLGWRAKSLVAENEALRAQIDPNVGMKVGGLAVTDMSGHAMLLLPDAQRPTILYIFSPGCRWCGRNLPSIRSLAQQRGADTRFIGISTTSAGLKDYLSNSPLPFPVFVANPKDLEKVRFVGTPQTVEISTDGFVKRNWVGAYGASTAPSMEKELSVKLPPSSDDGAGGQAQAPH